MVRSVKMFAALGISFATFLYATEKPVGAITLQLAEKCRALALNAHPYKLPGVPGPGTAAAQRDYFNDCVARGGNMPNEPSGGGQSGTNQPPAAPPPTNQPPAAPPPSK